MMGRISAGKVARVVLQVGVLDQQDIAGGCGDGRAHGRALALVLGMEHHREVALGLLLTQDVLRAVGGAVVDHDDFLLDQQWHVGVDCQRFVERQIHGAHPTQDLPQGSLLVVDRDQDGDLHVSSWKATGSVRRPARAK